MKAVLREQVEQCIQAHRQGELTEEQLLQLAESVEAVERPRRQDLLYLQTGNTSLQSGIRGMMLVRNGRLDEGPSDPKEWPYHSVLDAIRDGWRVIQFPDLALLMDDRHTYGLGCEFILERWNED